MKKIRCKNGPWAGHDLFLHAGVSTAIFAVRKNGVLHRGRYVNGDWEAAK